MAPQTATKLTYEDFLLLPDDGRRHEIIDGEHYVNAAPNLWHQSVLGRLYRAIAAHVEEHRLGHVFFAPVDVIFSDVDITEPDLVFVGTARSSILAGANIKGVPDLVVEVLSSTTRRYDERVKFQTYERYGVPEYWIVDPDGHSVAVYRHDGTAFVRAESADPLTTSLLPGFALSTATPVRLTRTAGAVGCGANMLKQQIRVLFRPQVSKNMIKQHTTPPAAALRRLAVLVSTLCALSASAATITVTSTADSGPGSLRAAMTGRTNGDVIQFAIGSGPQVIRPLTPLPLVDAIVEGFGFANGAKVTFDGIAATNVTVLDPFRVRARVPANYAGPATIAVSNPDGTTTTLTDFFRYTSPFDPSGCGSGRSRSVRH